MTGIIIYVLVAIVFLILFGTYWPYDENEWHTVDECGEPVFVSKTQHTIRLVVLATIWPLSVPIIIVFFIRELYRFIKK